MEIRRAKRTEAAVLTEIAQKAKAHWGYPRSWLEGWRDLLTITTEFLESNDAFVAVVDDQIVGFYALLAHQEKIRLEHLWVVPEGMRRVIGRELFLHAVEWAGSSGASHLTIES